MVKKGPSRIRDGGIYMKSGMIILRHVEKYLITSDAQNRSRGQVVFLALNTIIEDDTTSDKVYENGLII